MTNTTFKSKPTKATGAKATTSSFKRRSSSEDVVYMALSAGEEQTLHTSNDCIQDDDFVLIFPQGRRVGNKKMFLRPRVDLSTKKSVRAIITELRAPSVVSPHAPANTRDATNDRTIEPQSGFKPQRLLLPLRPTSLDHVTAQFLGQSLACPTTPCQTEPKLPETPNSKLFLPIL